LVHQITYENKSIYKYYEVLRAPPGHLASSLLAFLARLKAPRNVDSNAPRSVRHWISPRPCHVPACDPQTPSFQLVTQTPAAIEAQPNPAPTSHPRHLTASTSPALRIMAPAPPASEQLIASPQGGAPDTTPPTLRFLHYNDVYHVEAGSREPVGGYARFQSLVNYYRDDRRFEGLPKVVSKP
jgi:hypothetical protein